MKKGILPLLVMITLSGAAFAQNVTPDLYSYNYQDHGDRYHAKYIANTYGEMLVLTHNQVKKIYYNLLDIYKTPDAWRDTHSDRRPNQVLEAYTTHDLLKERMKTILNATQYSAYQEIKRYPEVFFEGGHR